MKNLFAFALLTILTAITFCTWNRTQHNVPEQTRESWAPQVTSSSTPDSPIRSIDFGNVAYPRFPDYSDPNGRKKEYVDLRPGEGEPNFLNYGDITSDGVEDAMVALGVENRGSAIPDYVYIFSIENGKPKLIWDFETGDRADGGLRNIYADNGQLVIELFGKNRVIGSQLYRGDEALCCPSSYTRTRYQWTGKRFELLSSETVDNLTNDANPLMPRYVRQKHTQ